jgi:adenylylsulfate kinase
MISQMVSNIVLNQTTINKMARQEHNGHKSCILWFTGLSGSGKSTLADSVESRLFEMGMRTYILDGDNIRHGLNKGLAFSKEDRKENVRRISEVAKLFVDAGIIVLVSLISPFREDRNFARMLVEKEEFIEIYVKCAIEECEKRDPKGLYIKARKGEIAEFTGVSSPYEEPHNPDIVIDSSKISIDESVTEIMCYLKNTLNLVER